MSMIRSVLRGMGHALPERVVENAEFETWMETSDAWIKSRSGIERRHFAAEGQTTSDLATDAARAALADAGMDAETLDAIVVATSTPDTTFPSVATMVQGNLGMKNGFAFDVQAVCAGFVFAMSNADALIKSGQAKRVLVIGAETFSRIMNWEDRSTCVLFGDGAGAVVLEAAEGDGTPQDAGILATDLNSDGSYRDLLYVDGGVSKTQTTGVLVMQGKEVFRHAVEKLAKTAETALEKAGLSDADVDWVVPHQANLRIIKATATKMNIPMDQVVVTVQDHGNTSAASIPLALSVAKSEGKFAPGQLLVMEAIGGGLAWGAVVLRL
ncbi:3-oxoacyl-[acyl-carrier-protein] synthase III [Litoreibacter ascidiaceicola]|uniref:Beta-ketoacyl-[acyl-carrier-protein] synthase III n=2 Tax=Litoreibacter ascidiaceicola TaxID=1486859 RepID=A0A1M4UR83_9RHOB|nr:3-oxoacyl-[acyl-carrier-protein] synthase III [Litoreibacter ascidiaceicola]